MKLLKDKKIAIVGGGPGGLTLARLLQMNGATIKVYERDAHKDARPKGATLDLHEESGLKALEAGGLMKAFNANFRPGADRLRIVDKNASIMYDDHLKEDSDRSRPEIDRGPLQNILLDSLQPDTMVWDKQFVKLIPRNDSWEIEFKDGASAFADIVIAADGANSKLRPYITPIKPFFYGITVIEGAVYNYEAATPKISELLKGGKIFAMGDERSLIVSSKGDGSLVFYTGCKTDENWIRDSGIDFSDKAQAIAWFKKEYAGWDSVWLELFENAKPQFITRPQYCMPVDQTWEALPNLTILGDAAHLMPPFAGEGVNMAMLDAYELSQCLMSNDFENVQEAIAAYEQKMRKRASATAQDSLDAAEAFHTPGAIEAIINVIAG
jgi:2-polyprenyl-6-methoxyphenol hydroxylase-like FAD-dependent oxidoreductase